MTTGEKWRTWVLVAVLGAGVVAAAFLLPRGDAADPALASAARRTMDGPGYVLTVRGPRGTTQREEHQAPDRLRVVISSDGTDSEIVAIGDTLYSETSCTTPSGTRRGFTKQRRARGRLFGTGTGVLETAERAEHATQVRPGVYAYSFRLQVPERLRDRLHVSPVLVEVHVERGRVRTFVLRFREEGHTSTTRGTFAYDSLPRIAAPSEPALDTSVCGDAGVIAH